MPIKNGFDDTTKIEKTINFINKEGKRSKGKRILTNIGIGH